MALRYIILITLICVLMAAESSARPNPPISTNGGSQSSPQKLRIQQITGTPAQPFVNLSRKAPNIIKADGAVGVVRWGQDCGRVDPLLLRPSKDGSLLVINIKPDFADSAQCYLYARDTTTNKGRESTMFLTVQPKVLKGPNPRLMLYPLYGTDKKFTQRLVKWFSDANVTAIPGTEGDDFNKALENAETHCSVNQTMPFSFFIVQSKQSEKSLIGVTRTDVIVNAMEYSCEALVTGTYSGQSSEREPTNLGGTLFKYIGLAVALKPKIQSTAITTAGPLAATFFDLNANKSEILDDTVDRALANLVHQYCTISRMCQTPMP